MDSAAGIGSAGVKDADADMPLHQRIRRDIENNIFSGTWKPGQRIPYEHELTAAYGCSRMTVSKALSALSHAGLIDRRKRAGTFVAHPHLQSTVLEIPDLAEEIRSRGHSYRFELHAREVTHVPGSAGKTSRQALRLKGVHYMDEAPLAVEDRLIFLSAVPDAQHTDYAAQSPGGWLLRHVPWTNAETRVSASAADTEAAKLLGVAPSAACLVIERSTWRGREQITSVRQQFPGSRYELIAAFQPDGLGVRR